MFMMTHVFLAMEDSKIPNEFISENGNPLQQSESYFHKNGFQNCEIFSELIKCCQLPDVALCPQSSREQVGPPPLNRVRESRVGFNES